MVTATLAGAFAVAAWTLGSESFRPLADCNPPAGLRLAHRGWISEHPPNSLGALLDAVREGFAREMDVVLLADDEVAVFHDLDMLRLAGVDREIASVTSEELKSLRLQRVIDGRDYGSREPIPTLREVLRAVHAVDPDAWMYIDIKTSSSVPAAESDHRLAREALRTFRGSPAAALGRAIFGTGHPQVARTLADAMDELGVCLPRQLYFHPGSLPGGEYLALKTRASLRYTRAPIVGTHWKVWESHPELVAPLREDGFVLTAYGRSIAAVEASPLREVIDIVNVDVPGDELAGPGPEAEVSYRPRVGAYRLLVAATVCLGLCLLGTLSLAVVVLSGSRRGRARTS